jgi:preprotein translocase subunit SecG
MGLFHFLIVVQAIIAASLVGIILMQRSEGGGLGMGGSPSGLMSARGAADFLTRTTTTLFIILSISLAFVAARKGGTGGIDDTLQRTEVPATQPAPAQTAPTAGAEDTPAVPAAADTAAPATEVPLDK